MQCPRLSLLPIHSARTRQWQQQSSVSVTGIQFSGLSLGKRAAGQQGKGHNLGIDIVCDMQQVKPSDAAQQQVVLRAPVVFTSRYMT